MNWKPLLIGLSLVVGILARPADETSPMKDRSTTTKTLADETTILTEKPVTEALIATTTTTVATKLLNTPDAPTTVRYDLSKKLDNIVSEKQVAVDENRELKASSNLQLTSSNGVGSEITLKESFHHGVAVPMSLEDYEKELAREKDMISKAKKKFAMEASTPKEGISTWILLSGSNDLTTTSRPTTPRSEPAVKPTYRIESAEKKPLKTNVTTNVTKKRIPVTTTVKTTPKPTQKHSINNKLITRVKVATAPVEITSKNETDSVSTPVSTTAAATTKKPYQTTKKKFTTTRPKISTTPRAISTTKTAKTATTTTTTIKSILDDFIVIDDERDEVKQTTATPVETSTFLIMEPKDADFNLPDDRSPTKSTVSKKTSTKSSSIKSKKKKIVTTIAPSIASSNSTKIKKKTKTALTKLSSKKPEKPISTQIYNFLAREVMPSVGVGLVGLVVTAGLATYFLGGPLGALRRSYDIANRRDDVAFDRSDDFGNAHDEGEMFGKVIAGMPENSAYRNNIRINSYRQRTGSQAQTPGQPQAQYNPAYPQYPQQKQQLSPLQLQQAQQQQYLRYRAADPYYNSYPQQNYVQPQQQQPQPYYQQVQPKSSDYGTAQNIQAVTENTQKFNIESVDMTTSEPSSSSYQLDYDEIAQSYFPQRDESQQQQVIIEEQKMQEETQRPQPQYQPQSELRSNEKVTIVNAQSVPSNHKTTNGNDDALPQPEALKMVSGSDEEYQNSIANAILNQQNQRKQFVVGSVVAENFEDNAGSIVPEHGPRRRRRNVNEITKNVEDNEIDLGDDDVKGQADEVTTSTTTIENHEPEIETTTQTYDISNGQNNIFQLFRRIVELKLRLGINFLQNATLAFQQYLRGVEERVQTSNLFNLYANNTSTNSTTSRKEMSKKVESL